MKPFLLAASFSPFTELSHAILTFEWNSHAMYFFTADSQQPKDIEFTVTTLNCTHGAEKWVCLHTMKLLQYIIFPDHENK